MLPLQLLQILPHLVSHLLPVLIASVQRVLVEQPPDEEHGASPPFSRGFLAVFGSFFSGDLDVTTSSVVQMVW